MKQGRKLVLSDIKHGTKFVASGLTYTIKTVYPPDGVYITVTLLHEGMSCDGIWSPNASWYLVKTIKNMPKTEV